MDPASNICYIVGAMSLTPDLRPYPVSGSSPPTGGSIP